MSQLDLITDEQFAEIRNRVLSLNSHARNLARATNALTLAIADLTPLLYDRPIPESPAITANEPPLYDPSPPASRPAPQP